MRPGDDPQEDAAQELRVTDRRRFTSTGDMRDESDGADVAPSPEPAEIPAPPAPSAPAAPSPVTVPSPVVLAAEAPAAAPRPSGDGAVYDLGIESVFIVFHQSALIALGATHPDGPPGRVDLAEARQAITFLKVLEDKTRGNLSPDEAAMLQDLLSEAQMAYVQVARSMGGGGA